MMKSYGKLIVLNIKFKVAVLQIEVGCYRPFTPPKWVFATTCERASVVHKYADIDTETRVTDEFLKIIYSYN